MRKCVLILGLLGFCFGQECVDIDGNVYETVQIGEQLWMAENLKVTHYNDGSEIPTGYSDEEWAELETDAYAVYDDDPSNADVYGNLYNWYTIDDDRGICPEGWHAPTDEEYTILTDFLGGTSVAGGKMKEVGIDHWNSPNEGATNESGFTGLPAGYRETINGAYNSMGTMGVFWSSTETNSTMSWSRILTSGFSYVNRDSNSKQNGFSIRCLADDTDSGTILVPEDYPTIQAGIDAASDGDTVLVAAGAYVENINFNGKNIAVIGEDRETTIIDGGHNGSVVKWNSGENSNSSMSNFTITNGIAGSGGGVYVEYSSPTLTNLDISSNWGITSGGGILIAFSSSILSNINITNNISARGAGICSDNNQATFENINVINNSSNNNEYGEGNGGGIDIYNSNDSINNSTISNNTSSTNGGAFYIENSTIHIEDSQLLSNESNYGGAMNIRDNSIVSILNSEISNNECNFSGGAIVIYNSELVIDSTIFENNLNTVYAASGGAIEVSGSSIIINDVVFNNNHTTDTGGAVRLINSEGEFYNSVFVSNSAGNCGGGIEAAAASSGIINNCTFSDNSVGAWFCGGGVRSVDNSNLNIINSVFYDNIGTEAHAASNINISYSLIDSSLINQDGETLIWLDGNIITNPQFTDPDNGDFTLQPTSPCIDAGDPETIDPDGTIADMGAYYYDQIENPIIYGCTGPDACNYNPEATIDDGSCTGPYLCDDMETLECDLEDCPLYGCLDETAINYNPDADINDGSCYHDTVTDIDGNEYQAVQIGEQLWMKENLKVTHYRNGDEIIYYDYDDNPDNSEIYGRLYNWFVVDDSRGVCPVGFHVSSDDEYKDLEIYLGMSEEDVNNTGWYRGTDEGSKLAGNDDLWVDGNLDNYEYFGISGFYGLPGGYKDHNTGVYSVIGNFAYFWTSTGDNDGAYRRELAWGNLTIGRYYSPINSGFSIRCLNDNIVLGCTDTEACNYNPDATDDDGSCEYAEENFDCDGNCIAELDCLGDCGGTEFDCGGGCDENVELWGECYNIEETDSLYIHYDLTGEIPPEIGNLVNLISLDLSFNQLSGVIPPEIGNLVNLEGLFLTGNQLSGVIPPEIGNLVNLEGLFLTGNQLTGEIPSEIVNLTNLNYLVLTDNQLTGEIPYSIGNLTNLSTLWLSNNSLNGEIPNSICELNVDWTYEGIFSMTNNQLCPPYPECIEEYVGYQNISNCDLSGECESGFVEDCSGDGDCCQESWIGNGLEDCEEQIWGCDLTCYDNDGGDCVNSLEIYYNSDVEIAGFQFVITGVTLLNVSGGASEEAGFIISTNEEGLIFGFSLTGSTIPVGSGMLTVLEVEGDIGEACLNNLVLSGVGGNGLQGAFVEECLTIIYETVFGCTDVSACNYNPDATDDDGSCEYPEDFGWCDCEGNVLDCAGGCAENVELWGECYNIEATTFLQLSYLTGEIPLEIGQLLYLTHLDLSFISLNLSGVIPSEIGNLINLTYLDLSGNFFNGFNGGFIGEIPVEICNLENLTFLNLSHNELTGEIPVEIGNLVNLDSLGLSSNQLTGEIPLEIGNLENLTNIHLGYNELTGEIPPEIGNLENLIDLILATNQLTGEIPVAIGNLENLVYLYLYDNQLTGEIPVEIGNLENLERLKLHTNQFTSITDSICNLTNLTWSSADSWDESDIYNNNLCPPYPECLTEDEIGYQDTSECAVLGCTDSEACNYNPEATEDDGSCEYPEENFDCDGNCIVEIDCLGDCGGDAVLDGCGICNGEEECFLYSRELHEGANLISFYALPEDKSLSNVLNNISYCASGIIGEGVAASNLGSCEDGGCTWVGSLNEIEYTSGYWLITDYECTLNLEGYMADNLFYELDEGANLISYPFSGTMEITEAIPDIAEGYFTGIIGEGVASSQISPFNWVGSLNEFQGTNGYWAKVTFPFEFWFILPDDLVRTLENTLAESPYDYTQSIYQAFYFIEEATLDGEPLEIGDWIIAYNQDIVVGARQWTGAYTDIPAMGYYDESTLGYCEAGDIPRFVVEKGLTGEVYELDGTIPVWENNMLFYMTLQGSTVHVPTEFEVSVAYPNPFNPRTTIKYGLPVDNFVSIVVYDLSGKQVASLMNEQQTAGFHSVTWDAQNHSSGLYFVKLVTKDYQNTQKVMLVK